MRYTVNVVLRLTLQRKEFLLTFVQCQERGCVQAWQFSANSRALEHSAQCDGAILDLHLLFDQGNVTKGALMQLWLVSDNSWSLVQQHVLRHDHVLLHMVLASMVAGNYIECQAIGVTMKYANRSAHEPKYSL